MSADLASRVPDRSLPHQTAVAIRGALARRDGRATLLVTGLVYLGVYLFGLGYLGVGQWGFDLAVVADPLARATQLRSPFQWEPIALVVAGPFEMLVSPLNLAVSVVAYRGPSACRLGPGAGTAAGLPGLLSGFACCGPTILLVVGLQASTAVLTLFQWLIPLTLVALVGTLLWVGTKVEG